MSTLAVHELSLRANTEQQLVARLTVTGDSLSFSGPRPPLFVPTDQLYYWTRKWQEGEKEGLADLEAGRSRVFSDLNELARYLTGPPE